MSSPEETDGELVDRRAFREMAAQCGWSTREFATFYAEGTRKELAALEAAHEQGALEDVRRLAHGARGSSAAACVPVMATAFYALEQAAASGSAGDTTAALVQVRSQLEQVLTWLERGLPPESADARDADGDGDAQTGS